MVDRDLVEHPGPPVARHHGRREGCLRDVAVVEGDHDRLGRERAVVEEGVHHLIERDRLIARRVQPRHLGFEVGV